MPQLPLSPSAPSPLLIVEDSYEDFDALQRFIRLSPLNIPLYRCVDGEQALDFLHQSGAYEDTAIAPRPGLIILDLNLPGTDGREVLQSIKQDDSLKTIPVIVFTTSSNPKDLDDCYRYGVNSYIVKPINFLKLQRDVQRMIDYWFEVTTLPSQ